MREWLAMDESRSEIPVEVEVVRLPLPGEEQTRVPPLRRRLDAFLPVFTGFFLDIVDFASRSPGIGLALGTLAGWWVGGRLRLCLRPRLLLTLAAAVYCAIPGTQLIPLGTVLGALCRIDLDKLRKPAGG